MIDKTSASCANATVERWRDYRTYDPKEGIVCKTLMAQITQHEENSWMIEPQYLKCAFYVQPDFGCTLWKGKE